jgi:hypothetical protein
MRRHLPMWTGLLALGVAAPAVAQGQADLRQLSIDRGFTVEVSHANESTRATPIETPVATTDTMVARLMSFDANHDGRVSRTELPERMQGLFVRADVSKDGALDPEEVRRRAEQPIAQRAPISLQIGHYGFGDDSGFDSRLHIEGAIEDLRLAGNRREEAISIGRRFGETVKAQARADLLAVAAQVLTPEQLADFKQSVDVPPAPALAAANVNALGKDEARAVLQAMVERARLLASRGSLDRVAEKYPLAPDEQKTLLLAVQRFQAHDRLSDEERSVLIGQLHDVLTDQERDDLRAALERRPIVKQQGVVISGVVAAVR